MRDITNSKGKIFRHFKGDLYLVEDFVKHSETQENMVLSIRISINVDFLLDLMRCLLKKFLKIKSIQLIKNTDLKNMRLKALSKKCLLFGGGH